MRGRVDRLQGDRRPSRLGVREFYQIAGYLLLDFDDRHRIRFLSLYLYLYLSRHGAALGWHVSEFLPLLGATGSLRELRAALQDLLVPPGERVLPGPDPAWTVPCPKCRAEAQAGCVTPRGLSARTTHAPRLAAIARAVAVSRAGRLVGKGVSAVTAG